ncbi:hypothetical protein OHA18_06240 [Kribbella sp. NBC_00709]|uniref:hypothetical protein n=1 Tax=Kribbella sp. NBC_00709 TaxID=2975972 RepID=UPI002E281093|nr:hypothetical protein [Kribbella sp. NBC_00709]
MTTPTEGPGGWFANLSQEQQQNLTAFVGMTPDQRQAAVNFISLDDRQQANLMRAANTDPMRDRIANAYRGAVARVHLTYDNTQQRISEAAQTLATQAREYRDAAVQGATNTYQGARDMAVQGARDVRDRATEVGQQVAGAYNRGVDRATEVGQQVGQQVAGAYNRGVDRVTETGQQIAGAYQEGRDRVVDMAQRGQVRLDQAWQTGADRLNQTGQNIADGARNTRDAVVGGARDARDAVRAAPGKVGRWFEGKFNNTMIKAESTLASFNAGRHDPSLQSNNFTAKDRAEMAQRFSAAMNAPTMEARNEILQGMAQQSQSQVDAQTHEAQQVAMRALSGVAPAGQAVSAPAQPQTSGQGEQTNPSLNKSTDKGSGIKR